MEYLVEMLSFGSTVDLIEGDPALAPIVDLYGSDMSGIAESDISDVCAALICTQWEPGYCTPEEVLECLKDESDWAVFPDWMQAIAIASMNASREASSALWDVIEARYPVSE